MGDIRHCLLLYSFLFQHGECGGSVGTAHYQLQLRHFPLGLCGKGSQVAAHHIFTMRHRHYGTLHVRSTTACSPVHKSWQHSCRHRTKRTSILRHRHPILYLECRHRRLLPKHRENESGNDICVFARNRAIDTHILLAPFAARNRRHLAIHAVGRNPDAGNNMLCGGSLCAKNKRNCFEFCQKNAISWQQPRHACGRSLSHGCYPWPNR